MILQESGMIWPGGALLSFRQARPDPGPTLPFQSRGEASAPPLAMRSLRMAQGPAAPDAGRAVGRRRFRASAEGIEFELHHLFVAVELVGGHGAVILTLCSVLPL
ncbi:hypothetical protein IT40_00295 [Paracoccus versutus]|nr:hypothetical protein IT40_00295 [Paracoccus versutus]